QEAIDAPAFHTSAFPSSFYPRQFLPLAVEAEERAGPRVIAGLRERGHDVAVRPAWSLGRVSAVAPSDGLLYAAATARGMQGYAVGRWGAGDGLGSTRALGPAHVIAPALGSGPALNSRLATPLW